VLWLQDQLGSVHFPAWRGEVLRFEPNIAAPRLMWLWTSLLREPEFKPRIAIEFEPVEVLPRGAQFLMRLNGRVVPEIQVELFDPLCMRPGTGGRFESRPVASQLRISTRQLGIHPPPGSDLIRTDPYLLEMEAATLRLPVDRVEIRDGILAVAVDSLNEAYMRASLRLEPELEMVTRMALVMEAHLRLESCAGFRCRRPAARDLRGP
jgi:hypothetical protein